MNAGYAYGHFEAEIHDGDISPGIIKACKYITRMMDALTRNLERKDKTVDYKVTLLDFWAKNYPGCNINFAG